ncbi:calmodulin-binding protein [Streptomyces sp. NBC_01565]|uniref:BP74-related protein n=1 Tax=unclassified Streptomyces TaxID=2593676 RepID=UPI002252C4D2|nr:calmodulin-binding protein [Streptomyces sp. NBC_01565]MCX4545514.1 calmodulin-binding protein [Streptomyces sp. NBC_01565]
MRRTLTQAGSLAAVSLFALALATPAQAAPDGGLGAGAGAGAGAARTAYFEFTDGTDTFVFQLTDPARIRQARDILGGVDTENISVMGKVVKAPASYNQPWKYTLAPESVKFFSMATEVCDASISYVNDHLDEVGGALLPKSTWCPWHSKLTREVTAP